MNRALRFLSVAGAVALSAGGARAHTGHGHDALGFVEGLRHAVGEPDHLLMLAFGLAFTALAAPRVLRLLRKALQALRERLGVARAASSDAGR